MATYEEILQTYFPILVPSRFGSYDAFDSEVATEDRARTEALLRRMLREAPRTAVREFGIDHFPATEEAFAVVDEHLDPAIAEEWMIRSNPQDPNNEFTLNVSELAVHCGHVFAQITGGAWRFARFPNYAMSTVVVGTTSFNVFDITIKKCSDDYFRESVREKFEYFEEIIGATRSPIQ